ncbi:MAG TPA: BamA/TamA family outer membrane protein [Vicinamibacterales bacterium]|jgi:outer membrane protein assembly factor BamA
MRLAALLVVFACAAPAAAQEHIVEIRVHGNHATPDQDILTIAGLAVGETPTPERLAAAEAKLRDSHRFESVEVRKRYESISDLSQILIILLVDEVPGVSKDNLTPGPLTRFKAVAMWLPILRFEDGYGFTYGARTAFVDTLGPHSRISVPLTLGGERRAAVEVERTFDRGPFSTIRGSAALDRRVNPHFDVPDSRREVGVQADRTLLPWLRAGADARIANVSFRGLDAVHQAAGVHAVVDTRLDPSFPRNEVLASVGWQRIAFETGSSPVLSTDLRGYVGVYRGIVLALRARTVRASSPLPPSEQTLLGGSDTLRGYRAGYAAGDGIAATSAELRVPLTSPLDIGRFGVKAFVDHGTTWPAGVSLSTRHFEQGIGAGIYFGAAIVNGGIDVAQARDGSRRWHFGLGVTF